MSFKPSIRKQALAVPAREAAAVLRAVLNVYEAARTQHIDDFESIAMRELGQVIGFDGAVWGAGTVSRPAGLGGLADLAITRATVVDRPLTLLTEYAQLSAADPVTAHFLACPDEPITVAVQDYYDGGASAAVGDYLGRHHIAHLLLLGDCGPATNSRVQARRWITAYRESARAFENKDVARLVALAPLWNQARTICLTRHMDRLARSNSVTDETIALCDQSGLIHAAEPAFGDMTSLREGDTIAPGVLASALAAGCADRATGVFLRARPAQPWSLVSASREGNDATLAQRELQVAKYYVDGLNHKQIARELGSSPSTVRTQLQSVYRKLDVHSRIELLRALTRLGPTTGAAPARRFAADS